MTTRTPLRLSLLDNAFDSLNESLAFVETAITEPGKWKFAVLHMTHALELLLKQRLRAANELLIWENVDRPGKTVTLQTAVRRLVRLDLGVSEGDVSTIERAQAWRNNITHYEVDLVLEEVRETYIVTFEFFDRFLREQLAEALTARIRDEHLATAAELMRNFSEEFVTFRGRRMVRYWPSLLLAAQRFPVFHEAGDTFSRFTWGSEPHWHDGSLLDLVPAEHCRDCGAALGQFHAPMCCVESCPKCLGQLLTCDCDGLESGFWDLQIGEDVNQSSFDDDPPNQGP